MAEPRIHVLYRTYAGENLKDRSSLYSKELCATSMVAAVEAASEAVDLVAVQDGSARSVATDVLERAGARVLELPQAGNSGSWLHALHLATRSDWPDGDLVYFVEDDYLHVPEAIDVLVDAFSLPELVPYVSLFEHPNTYRGERPGKDLIYVAGGRHWRTLTSTCMTFAARVGALRRDVRTFERCAAGPVPRDYELWLGLQGGAVTRGVLAAIPARLPGPLAAPVFWPARNAMMRGRRARRTQLVAPIPSAATHMDAHDLALGVDWAAVAAAAGAALA